MTSTHIAGLTAFLLLSAFAIKPAHANPVSTLHEFVAASTSNSSPLVAVVFSNPQSEHNVAFSFWRRDTQGAGTGNTGANDPTSAPEPSTIFLLDAGLTGLLGVVRRKSLNS